MTWHTSVGREELFKEHYILQRENKVLSVEEQYLVTAKMSMQNQQLQYIKEIAYPGSWRGCSGCMEMFMASSLDVKHLACFLIHGTEKSHLSLMNGFGCYKKFGGYHTQQYKQWWMATSKKIGHFINFMK